MNKNKGYIYFNNAATSYPKPDTVIKSVNEYMSSMPINSERAGVDNENDFVNECRKTLARFFAIPDENNIFFTSGSTESINLAIKGLDLKDKHVISTVMEHNSVIRPLKQREKNHNTRLTFIPCNEKGEIDKQSVINAISPDTIALFINHCSNVTGAVNDVKEIFDFTRKKGIINALDISQSAGNVNIDIPKTGADMVAFTGHKSLFALPGIGGLYLKKTLDLEPLKTGGTGIQSNVLYQPQERPLYYEAGTKNYAGIVSLKAGIDFINSRGIENVKKHKTHLLNTLFNELYDNKELLIHSAPASNNAGIFSFNIQGMCAEDVCYILEKSYGIILRVGLHCAPLIHSYIKSGENGCLRASFSYFNTIEEIQYFIKAIKEIIKAK